MYKDFKDYYRLLEVDFAASEADIKAAYRKMARMHHPDMHPDATEEQTRIFQEMTEAYETLSDPQKKMNYDFRYRQLVLGEGPQYEYYTDPTPEDTRVYEHKYTRRRFEGKIPMVRIAIALLVGFMVFKSVSQTASIEPERKAYRPLMSAPQTMGEDLKELLRHSAPLSKPADSAILTPGK